jgi:SAM-dependent methyltransferase
MLHACYLVEPVMRLITGEEARILDVGIGHGEWGHRIKTTKNPGAHITGIDIYRKYLDIQAGLGVYDELLELNIRDRLPFPRGRFDLGICCEVLEHVDKAAGPFILTELKRVCARVILTTPLKHYKAEEEVDGNKNNVHLSEWEPWEISRHGYHVKVIRRLSRPIYYLERLIRLYRGHNFLYNAHILAWC